MESQPRRQTKPINNLGICCPSVATTPRPDEDPGWQNSGIGRQDVQLGAARERSYRAALIDVVAPNEEILWRVRFPKEANEPVAAPMPTD